MLSFQNIPFNDEYPISAYYKDKNTIYTYNGVLSWVDYESFELLSFGYAKDNNRVYMDSFILSGADPQKFQILDAYDRYARDDKNVYYHNKLLTGADPQTFEVFGDDYSMYSKDKNHVYIWPRILTGADPSSFELVHNYNGESYAKDNNSYRKWWKQIDLPLDVTFDDTYVTIPSEGMNIPRHGRDPWDVYQMAMKGDV